jgi:hypothetical protein
MCKIMLRLIFIMLSFVGTFISIFIVMTSSLLHLNEAGPIDAVGNFVLIVCAVVASFVMSILITNNINNFISDK